MKRKSFEEKVQSMSAAQIIRSMIRGLRKEHVKVDMNTFGEYRSHKKTCYGCAATNCILEIYGGDTKRPIFKDAARLEALAETVGGSEDFLELFEAAINDLRSGDIKEYNWYADRLGIARIVQPNDLCLPKLSTNNYLDNLAPYEALAKAQGVK